jgi:hypothetical protein
LLPPGLFSWHSLLPLLAPVDTCLQFLPFTAPADCSLWFLALLPGVASSYCF